MGNLQSSSVIPTSTHLNDYYLSLPRDIQCLQLQYITDYTQIMGLLQIYPNHANLIKSCVREVIVNKHEEVVWSFEEFLQWPHLEATNVFVIVTTPEQYDHLIYDRKLRQISILLSGTLDPNNVGEDIYRVQNFLNLVYEFLFKRSKDEIPLKAVRIVSEYSFSIYHEVTSLIYQNGLAFSYDIEEGQIMVTAADLDPTFVDAAGNQIYLQFIRNILGQTKFSIQRIAFIGNFPQGVRNEVISLVATVNPTGIVVDFVETIRTMLVLVALLQLPRIDFFGIVNFDTNFGEYSAYRFISKWDWVIFFNAIAAQNTFFVLRPIDLALGPVVLMIEAPFGKGQRLMDSIHKIFPHMRKFIVDVLNLNILRTLVNNNFPVVLELSKVNSSDLPQYEEVLTMNIPIIFESPPENNDDRQELRRLMSIYPTLLSIKHFVQ